MDEFELEDAPETPVVETPKEEAKYVTLDDLATFASQIGSSVSDAVTRALPTQEEEEDVDLSHFQSQEALNNHLRERDARILAQARQEMATMLAPTQVTAGMAALSEGLDDVQKMCLNEAVEKIPANVRAQALADPAMQYFLKNTAIGIAAQKTGVLPTTNAPSANVRGESLSDRDKDAARHLMSLGFTKEEALKEVKKFKEIA